MWDQLCLPVKFFFQIFYLMFKLGLSERTGNDSHTLKLKLVKISHSLNNTKCSV